MAMTRFVLTAAKREEIATKRLVPHYVHRSTPSESLGRATGGGGRDAPSKLDPQNCGGLKAKTVLPSFRRQKLARAETGIRIGRTVRRTHRRGIPVDRLAGSPGGSRQGGV